MKLQLLALAAATVPQCSALAIQDILSDLKGPEDDLFSVQNPLDDALESSSTFTPAEVLDTDTDLDKYTSISTDDVNAWITNFFGQLVNEITNVPSDLVGPGLDLDISVNAESDHSNKTIYQLISESKYTTILAKIIKEDSELVDYLNSSNHKLTFFAPTDHAFHKIPHHRHHRHHDHGDDGDGDDDDDDHRIPKEVIRALLHYHSSPEVLNAAKLFHSHTIPSALDDPLLGTPSSSSSSEKQGLPQRLTVRAGFKGLTLNFYSHITAPNIGASNGLIHAIDSILIPPPPTLVLLNILPTKFSTFTLALYKTSLAAHLNTTSNSTGKGFTVFTPSNSAFQRLGLRINAFLFSPHGLPYLRALLKYHVVPGRTLYSDVLYTSSGEVKPFGVNGFTHLDLPTLLGDRKIAVDVAHLGPYVSFKLNGWQRVGFADVLGKDGVVHVLDRVLVPPRRLEGGSVVLGEGGEVVLEDLVERLRPWIEEEHEEESGVEEIIGGRATDL
ncbi:FAS1 domain-containing protein [Aspergillus varians]